MFLLIIGLFAAPGLAADEPPEVKEFTKRVDKYVDLQKKVESAIDPVDESASAGLLVKQKLRFARAMRSARAGASQGDIFHPRVRVLFRTAIREHLSGPEGAKARSIILGEGNPKAKDSPKVPPLKVNASYPTESPLSSVPPSLLLQFPVLPEGIEYRFIGRHLILFDTKTDLIVDFITDAVPAKK